MRIGMKLDADFDRVGPYQELYGPDVPARLRDLGAQAVEIPLSPRSDLEHVALQAQRCQHAGLQVSLHPYSEDQSANPAHMAGSESEPARVHGGFLALAAALAAAQGDTVVNIHPAAVRSGDWSRQTLVDQSVAFFAWARDWCEHHAPEVRPVAELQVAPNPTEPTIRIGDNPDELADVVTCSGVGACWDVGHAVWNHRRFGTDEDPTDAMLDRIAHVHCHDVQDADHFPPGHGDAPWRRFLSRLAANGYERTVIIEVGPPTFLTTGGLPVVQEALETVREALASAR